MAFISNAQKAGLIEGALWKLTKNIEVLAGTYLKGSLITFSKDVSDDVHVAYEVKDIDSGFFFITDLKDAKLIDPLGYEHYKSKKSASPKQKKRAHRTQSSDEVGRGV